MFLSGTVGIALPESAAEFFSVLLKIEAEEEASFL
jgi:hypothetical protein